LPCIKKVSVKKCHLAGPNEKLATTFLGALYKNFFLSMTSSHHHQLPVFFQIYWRIILYVGINICLKNTFVISFIVKLICSHITEEKTRFNGNCLGFIIPYENLIEFLDSPKK
jgi:hypothetical protein